MGVTAAAAKGSRNKFLQRKRGKSWRARELGLSEDEGEDDLGRRATQPQTDVQVSQPRNSASEVERPCDEDGWRWQEVSGASTSKAGGCGAVIEPKRSLKKHSKHGESWRELEVYGASTTRSPQQVLTNPYSELADGGDSKMVAPCVPELGDVVILGSGAPPEFRKSPAVVTRLAESHCTVTVLDDSRSFGIGECWPCFGDILIDSSYLRIGTRVFVEGMRGTKTQRLNGRTGTVSAHPKQGHPTFIRKPTAPDQPRLTVCVVMDSPPTPDEKAILLEARFLVAYDDVVSRATCDLENALARIVSSA